MVLFGAPSPLWATNLLPAKTQQQSFHEGISMETTFRLLAPVWPLARRAHPFFSKPIRRYRVRKTQLHLHLQTLLRKPLPAQALAVTGTAKYLRKANAARIVAECGAGKTFMALGTIHVLTEDAPSATLVMLPFAHHAQMGTRSPVDRFPARGPSSSRTCATAAIPASRTVSAK